MPLDGAEMFEDPKLAKLWRVECLLATEDQWCKGRLHDRRGRHCLVGAMVEVNARQELTRPVIRAIKEISGKHYWRVESFNDDPTTTHRDVLKVLDRTRLIIVSGTARADQPRGWRQKFFEKVEEIFATSKDSPERSGAGPLPIKIDPIPAPVSSNTFWRNKPAGSHRLTEETKLVVRF
jgi:hypothetical protein